MTACTPLQPRDVFCVIERLHRNRATAEEVVAGRYTHQGVTVDAGRNPDWLGSTLPADREWALEWRKCYFGLDLASAFRETGDPRFVEAWVRAVRSFIEQVPIELDTSDVTARRIQNWIYAWNGFRRANAGLGEDVAGDLLASLQRQVVRLRQHLTRERNHRTLELYALFIAALALPQIDHGEELLDFSIRELCANLRADMRADGTHRESSTHYHMVVLRSFVGLRQNAHQFGLRLADDFDARLALACEFAMHCHRPDGCIPALSDSDSGSYLDVLELAGELLGREDFLYVGSRGQRGRPPAIANVGFRDGGYFVQRSGWTGKAASGLGERFLIFDCGPLGDGGHGHYDLLNVEIAAGDRPLVVDPGRYTYLDAPVPWRRWFKGTPAHNTVSVDDLDQTFYFRGKPKAAVAQGRWLGRTTAEGLDMLWGEVQSPCYDAVHRRRILFVANEYWIVEDSLRAGTPHDYTLRFHLAHEAWNRTQCRSGTEGTEVRAPGFVMFVTGGAVAIEPGWVAPSYGIKLPAPVVAARCCGVIAADFLSLVIPMRAGERAPQVRVEPQSPNEPFGFVEVSGVGGSDRVDRVAWSASDVPTWLAPLNTFGTAAWQHCGKGGQYKGAIGSGVTGALAGLTADVEERP